MRAVFMGTPSFAVPSLERLATTTDLVAVYTRPDAASGRGKTPRPSPVKQAALERGIPVHQPATLRDAAAQEQLADLAPDLLVVAAYGLILPQQVLDIPRLGAVNVHASLLPRWRGAAPIQRAILAGDAETGVSIMRMEAGLDTGPYCRVARVAIGDATTEQLTDTLAVLGAETLAEALPDIEAGTCMWQEQDDTQATYADKITKAEIALDPGMTADAAVRRVRASSSAAPCRVAIGGRTVTLLAAQVADAECEALEAGRLRATKAGLLLGMADALLLVTRLKPEGKAEMLAADWARGVRDLETTCWERLT